MTADNRNPHDPFLLGAADGGGDAYDPLAPAGRYDPDAADLLAPATPATPAAYVPAYVPADVPARPGRPHPAGGRGFAPWATLIALAACLAGIALYSAAPDRPYLIRAVRVVSKPGLGLDDLLKVGPPSLYARLTTPRGEVRTAVRDKTVIGSGLDLPLSEPVALADVTEVQVWNRTRFPLVLNDSMWDRIDRPDVAAEGGKFKVELIGEPGPDTGRRTLGQVLMIGGAAGAAVGLIALVRRQTVGPA